MAFDGEGASDRMRRIGGAQRGVEYPAQLRLDGEAREDQRGTSAL